MVTNLTSAKQQTASRSSYVKLNQNPLESVNRQKGIQNLQEGTWAEGHILCPFEIGSGGWSDTIISKDGGVTWEKFIQEEDHW